MVPVLYIENMYDIWSSIYFMMLKNSFTIVFALYIISWFFCKSVLIKYALLFSQWYSSFCSWENNIACQIQVDDQSKKFWMQLFKEFFSTLIIYKLLINYLILNLQHLCYVTEFFFFCSLKNMHRLQLYSEKSFCETFQWILKAGISWWPRKSKNIEIKIYKYHRFSSMNFYIYKHHTLDTNK